VRIKVVRALIARVDNAIIKTVLKNLETNLI